MLILALESSAKPASAAVCSDGALLGQYFQNSGLTHSRTLLSMTESLLDSLGISLSEIGLVAVSVGPGSFTGIRIGVSAAKGLAWGLDIPVCGVSTLEAMSYQAAQGDAPLLRLAAEHPAAADVSQFRSCRNLEQDGSVPALRPTLICPVMDARRGQVYNALFERKNGLPVRICEDRAVSLETLTDDLLERGAACVLIGDGADISHGTLSAAGVGCHIAPGLLRWQTAYGVALAACGREPTHAASLEPCYLRPSQAERERNEESGVRS